MKGLKKFRPGIIVVVLFIAVSIVCPGAGAQMVLFGGTSFFQFLFTLTPVFIGVGLMDVWIERERMIAVMGETSGAFGIALSMVLGMLTAVPVYALLPVAGMLIKKGSRLANVLIFLCSSMGIRVPLLFFEASSLGVTFMVVRFIMNVIAIFISTLIIGSILTEEEKRRICDNCSRM